MFIVLRSDCIQVDTSDLTASEKICNQLRSVVRVFDYYPHQVRYVHDCVAQRRQVGFLRDSRVSGRYHEDGRSRGRFVPLLLSLLMLLVMTWWQSPIWLLLRDRFLSYGWSVYDYWRLLWAWFGLGDIG